MTHTDNWIRSRLPGLSKWPRPAAVLCLLLALSTPAPCASVPNPPAPGSLSAPANLPAASASVPPTLAFRIEQGREINRFLRSGDIAAHLVLRSGTQPRILVAFPAGDSGVGLWFEPAARAMHWRVPGAVHPVRVPDQRGRTLRGIEFDLIADVSSLRIRQGLLGSIRVLRDYQGSGQAPAQVLTPPRITGTTLSWARDRLDGAPGYRLSIEALDGTRVTAHGITAAPGKPLHLSVRALTGEAPLRPIGAAALLRPSAGTDQRERDVLSFLSYRQKYLAGSWRFDTYFGRDTLLALTLLVPVLQTPAVADGVESVLARLSPQGEVAHEEAIGEYAVLLNEAAGRGRSAAPVYDYGMIDEDFLLAPLAARWLLDDPAGAAQAAGFLARRDSSGQHNGDALMRNLRFVLRRTAAFASAPSFNHLIGLKPGHQAGDWRDSTNGLDGGTYPYDVNVALVPAALAAIERLTASGLLSPYLQHSDRGMRARAAAQRRIWLQAAPSLFSVRIGHARAAAQITQYAHALGIKAGTPLAALPAGAVHFAALALDASGHALPVMHSDESFTLLFGSPSPAQLRRALGTLLRPFPSGLLTPVGLLVADPVYADRATQARFTHTAYHGTVIWAWQQALLAAGLARQLARHDLPPALRARLQAGRARLWSAIRAASALRGSELWSWSYRDGRYRAEPFQPASGEAEADAAQLWSSVFLALNP